MNYNSFVIKRIENELIEKKILVSNNFARCYLTGGLTSIQWNIFFYGLYHLNKAEYNVVEFYIVDFCQDSKLNISNFYKFAKTNFKYIASLTVSEDDENKKKFFQVTNIINSITYNNNLVKIIFNKDIINNFQKLKKDFTYQDWCNFIAFSSSFSKNFYIHIRSFYHPANFSNYQTLTIIQIKKILGINLKKYSKSSHLKKIVLEPIINDINQYCSEFNLSYEDIKEGKKNVAFKFHIIPKQKSLPKPDNQNINLNFNLPYHIFFKQLFQRNYTEKENEILEPYLVNVNNDVINYLTHQISLKQKHFAINYLAKILDECLAKKIANNLSAVKEKYQDVFRKNTIKK